MTDPERYWVRRYRVRDVNPVPWKASEGSQGRGAGGRRYIQFHKPEELRIYQEAVKEAIEPEPSGELLDEPIALSFHFWRNRSGRTKTADATNLQKALEDALQGVLYTNDTHVKSVRSDIWQEGPDVTPMIGIRVWILASFPRGSEPSDFHDSSNWVLKPALKPQPGPDYTTLDLEDLF